jgi:hypothetical protein
VFGICPGLQSKKLGEKTYPARNTTKKSNMEKLKSGIVFTLMFVIAGAHIFAVSVSDLEIIASDGTFLGTLDGGQYSLDSIYNKYGGYGSKYDPDCILNKYGEYGSDYSDLSPFNMYASDPPGLYDGHGNFYGTLSINRYALGVTQQSYNLAIELKAYRDSL